MARAAQRATTFGVPVPPRLRAVLWFLAAVALTFLGLLAITFFIGRVVPIDPVLAVVGDRAPQAVYEAARVEHGPRQAAAGAVRPLCRRRADAAISARR